MNYMTAPLGHGWREKFVTPKILKAQNAMCSKLGSTWCLRPHFAISWENELW